MKDEYLHLHWIKCAYITFKRGGNFLVDVFKKPEKTLTAEDCMKLKDQYGIRPQDVIKLAMSHEFSVDDECFAKLLDKDEERQKYVKMCGSNEKNEKEENYYPTSEARENGHECIL
jgi:alanyl-tRNA synthetase